MLEPAHASSRCTRRRDMRARTLATAAALLIAATAVACSDQTPTGATTSPTAVAAARKPRPNGGPIVQAVSGRLSDGGSFAGTLTITSFSYDGTTLIANGVLSGTATTIDG